MKVLLINFSNRDFGNCGTIANFIKDNLNDEVIIKSFSNMKVSSCGSCKCECFEENLKCPFIEDDVYELYKHICDSGLVYFIVPNYCDYPCSNFFKFNERSLCFFSDQKEMLDKYESINKRFIVISNGEKENFINVFKYHTDKPMDTLFLSAKSVNRKSISGDLLQSDQIKCEILNFIK